MIQKNALSRERANEVSLEWETIVVSGTSAGRSKHMHLPPEEDGQTRCAEVFNVSVGNTNIEKDRSVYPGNYKDACRFCAAIWVMET